jgi:hypothetical protein
MKWMLIYIVISNGEPLAINANGSRHTFDDMYQCFYAREALSQQVGGENGYFPIGSQAVCIPVGTTT